jgi:hypothetical protein
MKALTCAATRRRLHAFHDRELAVGDQIAVSAHLEWCDDCATVLAEFRLVRSLMRDTAPGHGVISRDEEASFQRRVVNRVKAERDASFLARARAMFDDMHLVYAGVGAAVATVVCIVIMLGMMRFATRFRPDSLAAIVNFLATPGSNENPVPVDAHVLMPRELDGVFSTGVTSHNGADSVFTLAAVVTREGRVANLELLHPDGSTEAAAADQAKAAEGLLTAVSRARFAPARLEGNPVAVNMVWMVAHTTVRATKHHDLELTTQPAPKKRAASLSTRTTIATA